MSVQEQLDAWFAANPTLQQYVSAVWYIPEGEQPPPEVTHKLRLSSVDSRERALTVGLVVKPEYATTLDALLAMIATQSRP